MTESPKSLLLLYGAVKVSTHTRTHTHAQPIRFIPANHKCTHKCIHTTPEWLTCQSKRAFPPVIPPLFLAKLVRVNRNCFLDCFSLYVRLRARLSLLYESACVIYEISTFFSHIFSSNAAKLKSTDRYQMVESILVILRVHVCMMKNDQCLCHFNA